MSGRHQWDGDPGDPRRLPADRLRLEEQLRRTLAERAGDAPDATALTERLLAAGRSSEAERAGARRWTLWATPLVAAACVLALVGLLLVVTGAHHGRRAPEAARSAPDVPVATAAPSSAAPPAPTAAATGEPSPSVETQTENLTGVRIVDLTFTAQDTGWALASANCLRGPGRCTALLHTTDGHTWVAPANLRSPFDVPGGSCPAASCVEHLRFKDDSTGYAFGPHALFVTNDGGANWTQQAGGADDLEILDNTVIRVNALSGAPSLQVGAAGGPSWTPKSTAAFPAHPTGVSLSRVGHAAVLALSRLGSGGSSQPGVLLVSDDDGATWTGTSGALEGKPGDPCPFIGDGYSDVLAAATLASDGGLVADCASGTTGGPLTFGATITATDVMSDLVKPGAGGKLAPAALLAAATTQVQLVVPAGTGGLYRSVDQGNSWSPVASVPRGGYRFLGFENTRVGRLVSSDGSTIWTTRDAGATWTKVSF